jgi:hypothetical protein
MTRYTGSCHCNAVQFEVDTQLTSGLQCDCSICRRKNIIMHRVPKEQFRLVKGKEALTLYQWNTKVARHYFCKHCGIYTHHQPRTKPDMIAVNVGCIDDVNARQLQIEFLEGSKLSGGR